MVTKPHSQAPLWHTPDALWNQIAPILGADKQPGTVGRPATPNRVIFDALIVVLHSGCPWQAREDAQPIYRKSILPQCCDCASFDSNVRTPNPRDC